jgi:Zinc knuckle
MANARDSATLSGNQDTPRSSDESRQDTVGSSQQSPGTSTFDPAAALRGIDPLQLQQVLTLLGHIGSAKESKSRDNKPPTYAVGKLKKDASFQEREDWIRAVERGNATREDQPQWLYVQWASTWMEEEVQQQWRGYERQLHGEDFKKVLWQEFKDYVSSDYLGSNSAEIQAQREWMDCHQKERSPQEFYREWASLVRRIPGADIDGVMMGRDYWLRLDRFYHNRYAEAVVKVESAKDCAEWCERIWLARASSRNGQERDRHRKRQGSPIHFNVKRPARTGELPSYSGPRPDQAKIVAREGRTTQGMPLATRNPQTGQFQTTPSSHVSKNSTTSAREPICFACQQPGHVQRNCPNANNPTSGSSQTPTRIQAIDTHLDANQDLTPSDSEGSESENEER